jgi:hypothetical protein
MNIHSMNNIKIAKNIYLPAGRRKIDRQVKRTEVTASECGFG